MLLLVALQEIRNQGTLFLLAGYDTTSNLLAYLAYLLATNPHKQDILQAEIDEYLQVRSSPWKHQEHQMSCVILLSIRVGHKVSVFRKYPDTVTFAVSKSVSIYIDIKFKSIWICIWMNLESIHICIWIQLKSIHIHGYIKLRRKWMTTETPVRRWKWSHAISRLTFFGHVWFFYLSC